MESFLHWKILYSSTMFKRVTFIVLKKYCFAHLPTTFDTVCLRIPGETCKRDSGRWSIICLYIAQNRNGQQIKEVKVRLKYLHLPKLFSRELITCEALFQNVFLPYCWLLNGNRGCIQFASIWARTEINKHRNTPAWVAKSSKRNPVPRCVSCMKVQMLL